jgi:hypothetical protein
MEKKKQGNNDSLEAETVDASRRKLLRQFGKAAYVAPALTFLSFTANADGPPDLYLVFSTGFTWPLFILPGEAS